MSAPLPTADAILEAAEILFAESGFGGTTFRDIAQAAGVNLAAAHYHHGDKETLYLEILRRRLRVVNEARLGRLDAAERLTDGAPVPLERIFEILAGPLFSLYAESPAGARLIGRALVDPLPFLQPLLATDVQPVLARFAQAVRRHCPALSAEDFVWRYSFVIGALQHTVATLPHLKARTQGICRDDAEEALQHFVKFACLAWPTTARGSVS